MLALISRQNTSPTIIDVNFGIYVRCLSPGPNVILLHLCIYHTFICIDNTYLPMVFCHTPHSFSIPHSPSTICKSLHRKQQHGMRLVWYSHFVLYSTEIHFVHFSYRFLSYPLSACILQPSERSQPFHASMHADLINRCLAKIDSECEMNAHFICCHYIECVRLCWRVAGRCCASFHTTLMYSVLHTHTPTHTHTTISHDSQKASGKYSCLPNGRTKRKSAHMHLMCYSHFHIQFIVSSRVHDLNKSPSNPWYTLIVLYRHLPDNNDFKIDTQIITSNPLNNVFTTQTSNNNNKKLMIYVAV